jgi:hypothetical protein
LERLYIPQFLAGLLILLCISVAIYFVRRSGALAREKQKRRDDQEARERLALKRMAENDGAPRNTRANARTVPQSRSGPGGQAPDPLYTEGRRRPSDTAGSKRC